MILFGVSVVSPRLYREEDVLHRQEGESHLKMCSSSHLCKAYLACFVYEDGSGCPRPMIQNI